MLVVECDSGSGSRAEGARDQRRGMTRVRDWAQLICMVAGAARPDVSREQQVSARQGDIGSEREDYRIPRRGVDGREGGVVRCMDVCRREAVKGQRGS